MKHLRRQRCIRALAVCLTLASWYVLSDCWSHAATVTPIGGGLALQYRDESGATFQETIPVYHAGTIKYFSAGVGLEERSAKYPSFPLKLIFVAGPKAYLSQVSVMITDVAGKVRLEIPREHVTGPWLFVDLPTGTYELAAVGPSQVQLKERVTISKGPAKTVYLRWKEQAIDHKEAKRTL